MAGTLHWERVDNRLSLTGELTSVTLLPLWRDRTQVVAGVTTLDLSGLGRVDTSGLAILLHLLDMLRQQGVVPQLAGTNDNLVTLAQLYNLPQALFPHL